MNDSSTKRCVWYISKYLTRPNKGCIGARGYFLMREIARQGIQCVVVVSDSNMIGNVPANKEAYESEEVDGLTIRWVRTFKYSIAKSLKRIVSWLHFEWRLFLMPEEDLPPPNVLVVSSLSPLTIINGFRLRRKYKCRLVCEIRDIWPLTLVEEGGFSRFNPFIIFLAWIEKIAYANSDVIVGTMPNLKEHVHNILGVQKDVYCIPIGIDEESLSQDLPISTQYVQENIPADKFVIAYAGTIGITNALNTYFECASSLEENSQVQFLVIGDGDLKKKYLSQYGGLQNLTFAPKVPKNMLQSVLSKCDVLYFSVHESKVWHYGQSLNKISDYMLAGKPIIGSYTGFPSMINEADCGTFVPANDAEALRSEILRFSEMSPQERTFIGERGAAWIRENRNYKALASRYLSIMFP